MRSERPSRQRTLAALNSREKNPRVVHERAGSIGGRRGLCGGVWAFERPPRWGRQTPFPQQVIDVPGTEFHLHQGFCEEVIDTVDTFFQQLYRYKSF